MTKKRKAAVAVLTVLLLANLCFIWGNSLVSRSDSHDLSVGVLGFLPGFLRDLFPDQEQLVHIVRKAAHFTEFLREILTGQASYFSFPVILSYSSKATWFRCR